MIATRYLIEAGHKNIAHITTGGGTQSIYERMMGYQQALKRRQLRYCLIHQVGSNSIEGGKVHARLLALENRPTAVFASHDMQAGAYEVIFEAGLSIPDDISVIGHDNIEFSQYLRPKRQLIPSNIGGEASVDSD